MRSCSLGTLLFDAMMFSYSNIRGFFFVHLAYSCCQSLFGVHLKFYLYYRSLQVWLCFLRGLVKWKTRIGQTTPTHPLSIFFEIFTTIKNNTKITKTHKIPPKKYQSELGFDKPTHPLHFTLCSNKTLLFVTEPWRCWHGSKTMLDARCYFLHSM